MATNYRTDKIPRTRVTFTRTLEIDGNLDRGITRGNNLKILNNNRRRKRKKRYGTKGKEKGIILLKE